MSRFMVRLAKAVKQPRRALSIVARRAQRRAAYAVGSGRAPAPESIVLHLTNRCNMRCRMCGQWGEAGVMRDRRAGESESQLPLQRLLEVIDQTAPEVPSFTLFGGEPFLYRDWRAVVERIVAHGRHASFVSNGFLVERAAEDLVGLGAGNVTLSVNGPPAVHDDIVGRDGAFDRIAGAFDALRRLRADRGGTAGPTLSSLVTVTETNADKLPETLRGLARTGVEEVTVQHLSFISQAGAERHAEELRGELGIEASTPFGFVQPGERVDVEALNAGLEEARRTAWPFRLNVFPDLPPQETRRYYLEEDFRPRTVPLRCTSPWSSVTLYPDGQLTPCLDFMAGNVADATFQEIWNAPRFVEFRKVIRRRLFPYCYRCCGLYRY